MKVSTIDAAAVSHPASISRTALLLITLFAFGFAFSVQLRTGLSRAVFGDAESYMRTAERLLAEGTYPSVTDYFFFRPPGYPWFIAAVTAGNPRSIAVLKFANAVLHALSALSIALLATRVARSPAAGKIAGVWAAANPLFLYMAADVQSETLFITLFVAAILFLIRASDIPSPRSGILGGALLSMACLTRPSGLFVLPLLLAYLADSRWRARLRALLLLAAAAGVVLVLGPWTARNWIRFRGFMPVNNATGFVIYQGNSQWMVDFFETRTKEEYLSWLHRLNHGIRFEWRDEIDGLDTDQPKDVSGALARAGWRWIAEHPRAEAGLLMNKAIDWLRPWASPRAHSRPVVWISCVYYVLVYLLAIGGLKMSPRRGLARLAGISLIVTMAGHLALITQLRYRAAQWDPILIVYASVATTALFQRIMRKRSGSQGMTRGIEPGPAV